MKSSKRKLKKSLHFNRPDDFDKKFWEKFDSKNQNHNSSWLIPMSAVFSCLLVTLISFNTFFKQPDLTYNDFDSYISMQFELEVEDELIAEVVLDDDILFE